MDHYSCTCGGENPNCFKCDGTGLVKRPPPPLHPPGRPRTSPVPSSGKSATALSRNPSRPSPVRRSISGKTQKPKEDQIACPLCGFKFSKAIELVSHLLAEHPAPAMTSAVTVSGAPSKAKRRIPLQLSPCPHCEAPVGDVEKHINRVHGPEAKARRQARQERRAQRKKSGPDHAKFNEQTRKLHVLRQKNPRAVICGMCGVFFPSIEGLRLHLADAHRLNSGERSTRTPCQTLQTSTSHPRGNDVPLSDRKYLPSETDNPFAQEARDKKMDATYGMGGTARDHGQFGSASSYDGMDDESTP
jgi:hypothetical protein